MQHNTRNQVPSASKPSFHLDMKTSESFLLAFLVWFVSCDSVNVPACQTECLAFPRMPSFFEIGQTPVTGLGVKCRVVATSQTKHHVCLLNITGIISKISPTQKIFLFRCPVHFANSSDDMEHSTDEKKRYFVPAVCGAV